MGDVSYSVFMCIIFTYSSFVIGRNKGYREVISKIKGMQIKFKHDPANHKPYYGPEIIYFDAKASKYSYLIIIAIAMLLWIMWNHLERGIGLSILLFYLNGFAFECGLLRSEKTSKIIFATHFQKHRDIIMDEYVDKKSDVYLDYIYLQAEICGTEKELPDYSKSPYYTIPISTLE